MSLVEIVQAIGLITAALTLVQLVKTVLAGFQQRDDDLVAWGKDVISLMIQIEQLFVESDIVRRKSDAKALSFKAGEMLDFGRLFFRNVEESNGGGFRPQILDQVVKASYIANAISTSNIDVSDDNRLKAWACRKQFVKLLQREMGWSLKKRTRKEAGDSIPHDPNLWPTPRMTGWWKI